MNTIEEQIQLSRDDFIVSLILLLDLIVSKKIKGVSDNSKKLSQALLKNEFDANRQSVFIKKAYSLLNKNLELLLQHNRNLFKLTEHKNNKHVRVTIVPAIDIDAVYDFFTNDEQNLLWEYMLAMHNSSSTLIDIINNPNQTNNLNIEKYANIDKFYDKFWALYPDSTLIMKRKYDNMPFIGVGSLNENYDIKTLHSGPELLPEQTSPNNFGGMAKMFGIEKMIDIDALRSGLKNISPEEIDKATASIKEFLGDVDENTTNVITEILTDITSELKKDELSSGNPIDNLFKIAENVTQKVGPKLLDSNFDVKKLLDNTKNAAAKLQQNNGNMPLFNNGADPFALLTKLMDSVSNTENTNENENKNKTADQCMQDCQNLLKGMGINMNAEQLKNLPIDSMFKEFSQTNNTKSKKHNNKK